MITDRQTDRQDKHLKLFLVLMCKIIKLIYYIYID